MKLASIIYEAKQNLKSGTTRAILLSLLFTVIISGFALADLKQIQSISQDATKYQEAGGSISVLKAPGRIDATACEALNQVSGIRAAGALRNENDRLTLSALPGAPVPTATVTTNFPKLLGAKTGDSGGPIFSDQVVTAMNFKAGDTVSTTQGQTTVGGTYTYPSDGRTPGYGYMALIPSGDTEAYDECWADIWPQDRAVQQLLFTAVLPAENPELSENNPTLGQLNGSLGTKFDGVAKFENRITKYTPYACGVFGFALGFMALRTRRLQLASDLHAGVSRGALSLSISIETVTWLILGAALSCGIILTFIADAARDDRWTLTQIAGQNLYSGIVAVGAGTVFAWVNTREKHLFKYFKNQ